MINRLLLLLLCFTLPSSEAVFAQAPTVSVRGTIAKFDPSTRTLSLTTARGPVQLPIPPSTRIRQGWRKVDALELQNRVGERATVRYTESGGGKSVESVHLFPK